MITVEQLTPSEALTVALVEEDVRQAIFDGYNFRILDAAPQRPITAAFVEYQYDDDEAVVFHARKDGKFAGSFTLHQWSDDIPDNPGKTFTEQLHANDPVLAARVADINPTVYNVGGIVVPPELRDKDIAKELVATALETVQPGIVLAQTQRPEAVAIAGMQEDFRAFYGTEEVTLRPGVAQPDTTEHFPIMEAFLAASGMERMEPEGVVYQVSAYFKPCVPNVADSPLSIRRAFAPVRSAQRRYLGIGMTVMSPLILVQNEILPVSTAS